VIEFLTKFPSLNSRNLQYLNIQSEFS